MTKISWENTDFIADIISCLPNLGTSLQAASFYCPPDSNPNDYAISLLNNFPLRFDDIAWQVNFALVPQLDQWFSNLKGKNYPKAAHTDEESDAIAKEYRYLSLQIRQLFSISAFLAMIGQFVPYGKVALFSLLDKSWGEIINSAAVSGLLFLGEKDIPYSLLRNVFGNGSIDLENKWNDIHSRDLRCYRVLNPEHLPGLFWKQVFASLGKVMEKDDPLLLSLLSYAKEKEDDFISREILLLALDLGSYTPLTITGFVQYCKLPGSDFKYFQKAVKDSKLKEKFPEIVKDLEDRNQYYLSTHSEEL